jgi:hypothetical protein
MNPKAIKFRRTPRWCYSVWTGKCDLVGHAIVEVFSNKKDALHFYKALLRKEGKS